MSFGNDFGNDEVMSEINMTPLVDVMLVLLIIFIITLPVISHSIKIDLPRVDNKPNEIKAETISLSITDKAEIYWNDKLISKSELTHDLSVAAQQQPQPEFQLRGARQVEYEHVVQLMAAVQKAGIQKLGFVTVSEN